MCLLVQKISCICGTPGEAVLYITETYYTWHLQVFNNSNVKGVHSEKDSDEKEGDIANRDITANDCDPSADPEDVNLSQDEDCMDEESNEGNFKNESHNHLAYQDEPASDSHSENDEQNQSAAQLILKCKHQKGIKQLSPMENTFFIDLIVYD
ncbi:hypothetical protein ARMSODRAFT_973360 [Armillaria solidipes]|uniref:Uncharacterized protein n=1 Tax=Armillaria solidipes TaxID=1076256 RepID=A0A2H3BLN1_9AGAR|nr:hypothetical protein ARMSODRAFT_973360 [Armillaria solidipes]